jgi:hypothetical protein
VLGFVAEGGRKTEAARVFRVARSAVFEWLKEGSDHVPGRLGPKDSRKIDRQQLREAIEARPDLISPDLNPIEKLSMAQDRRNAQCPDSRVQLLTGLAITAS